MKDPATPDEKQHRLDQMPAAIDEIGARPPRAPRMRLVNRIRGPGYHGFIYRAVDNPRLSRMEVINRVSRSKTVAWCADNQPAKSLQHALATIATTPAPQS